MTCSATRSFLISTTACRRSGEIGGAQVVAHRPLFKRSHARPRGELGQGRQRDRRAQHKMVLEPVCHYRCNDICPALAASPAMRKSSNQPRQPVKPEGMRPATSAVMANSAEPSRATRNTVTGPSRNTRSRDSAKRWPRRGAASDHRVVDPAHPCIVCQIERPAAAVPHQQLACVEVGLGHVEQIADPAAAAIVPPAA